MIMLIYELSRSKWVSRYIERTPSKNAIYNPNLSHVRRYNLVQLRAKC